MQSKNRRPTPQLRPVVSEPYAPILDPEWDDGSASSGQDASDGDSDPVEDCSLDYEHSSSESDYDGLSTPPRAYPHIKPPGAPTRPPRMRVCIVDSPFMVRGAKIDGQQALMDPPRGTLRPRKLVFNLFLQESRPRNSKPRHSRQPTKRGAAKRARE